MSQNTSEFIQWFYRSIVMVAIMVGAWFGKQVWDGQKEIILQIQEIKINEAAVHGNRFTSADWVRANDVITSKFNDTDKRISRIEDRYDNIKLALDRIEGSIGKLPK